MKHFFKYFALMVLVLASGRIAHASVLDGTLSFSGKSTSTSTGITFKNGSTVAATGTQDLSGFTPPGPIVSFTKAFSNAGISSTPGGEQMFLVANTAGTQKLQFVVNAYGMVNGKLTYYGLMSLFNHVEGHADTLVSSNNAVLTYSQVDGQGFTASITTAPEPNSLILLGTGLAAVGFFVRRRTLTHA